MIEKDSSIKVKSKLGLVVGFYNPTIILGVIALYINVYYFPFKFVPDYWRISEIENFRGFIWGLLTVTLGFSGLILTLLLLSYNFFIKSTKRNTLEFIFDNIFLKILFSGFVSILLVQVAAFCMINKDNRADKYAVIYFLLILTVTYILAQLPIAILGLKYSTSIDKINKIFGAIDHNDVEYLVNTSNFLEKHSIEEIESNKFVLLKDIGLSAIKDSDWVLPQKILNNTYKLVTQSIDKECPVATVDQSIYIFLWLSKHFQRAAIKNGDQITVTVLVGHSFMLYDFLVENKLYKRDLISTLDDSFKELILSIIECKDFSEIRDSWVREFTEAMAACVLSLNFSDEALPTHHYIFSERGKKIMHPRHEDYYDFWHHVNHSQSTMLMEVLEYAIRQKDSRFYDTYDFQIRKLMDEIASTTELTDSQKREYLSELLHKTTRLDNAAIDNGLFDKLKIVSHLEIERWAKNGWPDLYRPAMYYQVSTLKEVIKIGKYYNSLLDEFFMLGRSICNPNSQIELQIKNEILTYILETGLKLIEYHSGSLKFKYDIQYQINWLFTNFLKRDETYKDVVDKFIEKVSLATDGFDYYNRPEF